MSRVAIIGNNSVEYVGILLNIWKNNDSAVLIDYDTPAETAISMLLETGVSSCYIEDTIKSKYGVEPLSVRLIEYSLHNKMPCVLPMSIRSLYKERYDESEAIVIFSSGTTGKHKGVSLSHRAINNNADSIIDYMKPSRKDAFYLNKKLTHCSTLIGELLVALKTGADIVLSKIVIPPRVAFKTIADFNVTILCCNPMLIDLYVGEVVRTRYFPKSVKVVYTCGDVISKKTIERARQVFERPVYNVYGQTECGPRITAQTEENCSGNSVGIPILNVAIKISNQGEILVKSNSLFTGYTNTDAKSKAWHHTGDLGFIDKNGELYVTGRMDNMIVINAHNVFPEKIEKTIIDNTDIDDCIVYNENAKLICDYVGTECSYAEIVRVIKPLLMPYEMPRIYRKIVLIAKNKNGKKTRKCKQENANGED